MIKKEHGGNIYKKSREAGIGLDRLLDFSANINPLGLPAPVKAAMVEALDESIHYPDPECVDLRQAIAKSLGTRPDYIICGNGGAARLYRLAYGLHPRSALIPEPSFAEYEEACRAAGTRIDYYMMDEDFVIREDFLSRIKEETDLVFLCNPNNPTGLLTGKEMILRILDKAREVGSKVLVDESFLELCPGEADQTLIPELTNYKNLLILRSFTKLYAMPGVRLGFLLCADSEIIEKIGFAGQSWSVSNIAQKAGIAALAQSGYKERVLEEVQKELLFMKKEMSELPVRLYDGMANYLFFRAEGEEDLDRRLWEEKILIRSCRNYVNLGNDYYRVAVKSHEENLILLRALRKSLIRRKN